MNNSETSAWLAGFVDGEGSIGLYNKGPRISVTQNEYELLERVRDEFDVRHLMIQTDDRHDRPCYCLQVQATDDVVRVLLEIMPYMRHPAKVLRAQEILTWYTEKEHSPACASDAADVG